MFTMHVYPVRSLARFALASGSVHSHRDSNAGTHGDEIKAITVFAPLSEGQ